MTNARVGSQAPATSKKPITLSGRVMPAMPRPAANSKPQTKLASKGNCFLMGCLHG